MYLLNEIKLNLILFTDRIRASIKAKRWISEQEYYEIRRGN